MSLEYLHEFVDKKDLPAEFGVSIGTTVDGVEYLNVKHPLALARFVSFVKYRVHLRDGEVYLRGQTNHYPGLIPALFRNATPQGTTAMFDAYKRAITAVQELLPYNRFHRSDPGALFQHYGLKTHWIDLVDNLYTAAWFATHEHTIDTGCSYYSSSKEAYGWILLIATRSVDGQRLECIDLRKNHSSMNVRLHAQHGVSASAQHDNDDLVKSDYGGFIVARVRIENSKAFRLRGLMAATKFLFPPSNIDESFALLLSSGMGQVLTDVELSCGLRRDSLGRINQIRYRRPRTRKEQ